MNSEYNRDASSDAYTQNYSNRRIASLRASRILVEHADQWQPDAHDEQTNSVARIELKGKFAGPASSAVIYFYPDGDRRICQPAFDAERGQIVMYMPLSGFETQLDMLSSHYEIECSYFEAASKEQRHACLIGHGPIPDELN